MSCEIEIVLSQHAFFLWVMTMKRKEGSPLIGMPMRLDVGQENQYLSRLYMEAVAAAGGVPVLIPLLESAERFLGWARRLDGIVLTGSNSDVNPARYGAPKEKECGPVQPLRDATDFMLLDAAQAGKKPLLAICFGMQSLNVHRGGTLIQDIPTHRMTSIQHDFPASQGKPSHDIEIERGSILHDLASGVHARVNSTHHQAVDEVGSGLRVIARAPDGVIEALDGSTSDHLLLAVQWHPEKSHAFDDFSRRIFEFFVERCREESER
jgi:putative glutamine amidotransferase